jgi:hypothetical protein
VSGELVWSPDTAQTRQSGQIFQVAQATQPDTTAQGQQKPVEQKKPKRKSPLLAFLMSTFIPSSGQFYNGQKEKGALQLALIAGGLVIHFMSTDEGDKEVLGDPGLVIVAITWMWSMFDAPISAYRINEENERNAGIPSASLPERRWDLYGSVSSGFDSGRAGLLVRF